MYEQAGVESNRDENLPIPEGRLHGDNASYLRRNLRLYTTL